MTTAPSGGAGRRHASDVLQQAWLARGGLSRALLPLALLYGGFVRLRRALYRRGWLPSTALPVPVVVVGNLVAGGAGKTPTVIAVVAMLQRRGYTPGIVSRGYGRRSRDLVMVQPDTPSHLAGDEPLVLRRRTGAPVMVGRDRVAAAHALLRAFPAVDVLVCDDGLQHLRLRRSLDIIVFDERGIGNGWLLPAGPLREPMPASPPPRCLVLYNATHATTPWRGELGQRRLTGVVELDAWWRGEPPSLDALADLRGRPVVAAAGIARPERFFQMLRDAGIAVVAEPLPDHHDYAKLPWPSGTVDVIVTEKDAAKLDPGRVSGLAKAHSKDGPTLPRRTRVWVAALDFAPAPPFERALLDLIGPVASAAATALPGHRHGTSVV